MRVWRPSQNLFLQKDTERRHIELFLELASLEAVIELGDRPDCVLVLPDGRVALEHRELVDQGLQAHRPHLKRLQQTLLVELEARGLLLEVQVHFPPRSTYLVDHPRRMAPLARQIADVASAHAVQLSRGEPVTIAGGELLALGIEGPSLLALQRSDVQPRPSVQLQGAHAAEPGAHRVIEAVRSKEAKLSSYVRDPRVRQLWLLLVAGEGATQPVASMLLDGLQIESRFDRVYVLDARERRLLCVKGH